MKTKPKFRLICSQHVLKKIRFAPVSHNLRIADNKTKDFYTLQKKVEKGLDLTINAADREIF